MRTEFDAAFQNYELNICLKTHGEIYVGKTGSFKPYYCYHNKDKDYSITVLLNEKDKIIVMWNKGEEHNNKEFKLEDISEVKTFIKGLI